MRLAAEIRPLGREWGSAETKVNAHVDMTHDFTALGELERALEHMRTAEQLFEKDVWFRWRYSIRLQAKSASHYIERGNLTAAITHAEIPQEPESKATARKQIAVIHRSLDRLAQLQDRQDEAAAHFQTALHAIKNHAYPSVAWLTRQAAAECFVSRLDLKA